MAIAEIHVTLKPTLLDTQGATVLKALRQLGHSHVQNVRIGKHIAIELDDASPSALQAELDAMCRELLANPVIEDYSITLDGQAARASTVIPETPRIASTDAANTAESGIATSDVVPHPQPLKANAGLEPAPPAQMSAPRISAPQNITVPPAATTASTSIAMAPPSAVPATQAAVATMAMPTGAVSSLASETPVANATGAMNASLPDPFALDYAAYDALTTVEKLALQERAWQSHGTWIANELNTRRAAWVLCLGQSVLESGASLDTYPSDERLETLGVSNDLVPHVFVRPPA